MSIVRSVSYFTVLAGPIFELGSELPNLITYWPASVKIYIASAKNVNIYFPFSCWSNIKWWQQTIKAFLAKTLATNLYFRLQCLMGKSYLSSMVIKIWTCINIIRSVIVSWLKNNFWKPVFLAIDNKCIKSNSSIINLAFVCQKNFNLFYQKKFNSYRRKALQSIL